MHIVNFTIKVFTYICKYFKFLLCVIKSINSVSVPAVFEYLSFKKSVKPITLSDSDTVVIAVKITISGWLFASLSQLERCISLSLLLSEAPELNFVHCRKLIYVNC